MAAEPMPDETIPAVLLGSFNTVIFRSRPYRRAVRTVFMNCGVTGGASIYKGQIAQGGAIAGIKNANPNTYNVPFVLPPGYTLYVVFTANASPAYSAFATLSASREW